MADKSVDFANKILDETLTTSVQPKLLETPPAQCSVKMKNKN